MTRRNRTKAMAHGRKVGALSAGLLAAGLTGGAAASAEEPAQVGPDAAVCTGDDRFGIGCFQPDGDHIIVEDFESDGWRIEVQWETDYGRSGVCAIPSGKDFRDCNYNMAEGRLIYFEVHGYNAKFGLHEVFGAAEAVI